MAPMDDPAQSLLIHADFVRRIATALTRDPVAGEDLAQEVWVRALERPPVATGSVRGWFARTARNLWSNERRTERRRRRREEHALPPPAESSPAEISARESLRQVVVQKVLSLQEPYRRVVLLHFFDGLRPAEIARRIEAPAATVRSQLARALRQLRQDLDRDHGGDRKAWLGGVGALAAARAPVTRAALLGLMMKNKIAALVALVLVSLAAWPLLTPASTRAPAAGVGEVAAAEQPDRSDDVVQVAAAAGEMERVRAVPSDRAAARTSLRLYPADRGIGQVHGTVFLEDRPCAGVEVVVEPWQGTTPALQHFADDRQWRHTARSAGDGSFSFVDLDGGPVRLIAQHDGLEAELVWVAGPLDVRRSALLQLKEPRFGRDKRIRVTHDGLPVAGVTVAVYGWDMTVAPSGRLETVPVAPSLTQPTGDDGIAELRDHGLEAGVAIARHGERLCGRVNVVKNLRTENDIIELALAEPASLDVRVEGFDPASDPDAVLELYAAAWDYVSAPFVGARIDVPIVNGRFAASGLPAGTWGFYLRTKQNCRISTPVPDSTRLSDDLMAGVQLAPGEHAEVTVQAEVGGVIRGVVTCGGAPLANATVRTLYDRSEVVEGCRKWSLSGWREHAYRNPAAHHATKTDAEGRYELRGLPISEHHIEVLAAGYSFEVRKNVPVTAGAATELRHELSGAGVLQIATLDALGITLTRTGESEPLVHVVPKSGCATLPGLAAGAYVVHCVETPQGKCSVQLAEAVVHAGRTTWLDLRDRMYGAIIRGRVMSGANPVTGAKVSLGYRSVATDLRGEYELRYTKKPNSSDSLAVAKNGISYRFRCFGDKGLDLANGHVRLGTRTVEFVCRDVAGNGAKAELFISHLSDRGEYLPLDSLDARVRTDEAGVLRLGPVPNVPLFVVAEFDNGYRIEHREVAATVPRVVLQEPVTFALTAKIERDRKPLAKAFVIAMRWTGEGEPPPDYKGFMKHAKEHYGFSDENGVAKLKLVPGLYWVRVGRNYFDGSGKRIRITDTPLQVTVDAPKPRRR